MPKPFKRDQFFEPRPRVRSHWIAKFERLLSSFCRAAAQNNLENERSARLFAQQRQTRSMAVQLPSDCGAKLLPRQVGPIRARQLAEEFFTVQ